MNILYLMTEPFGIGGVQSDLLVLSAGLRRHGHRVLVATTEGVLLPELLARGAEFFDVDFRFRDPRLLARAAWRLRRLVAEQAVDLVAPQSVRSSIAAYAALRVLPSSYRSPATGRRVPIVTTIHNIHNPRNFRWAGRILRRCADYVIFESHYERNRVVASGLPERNSEVIHSGIDTDRLANPLNHIELAARYGIDSRKHLVYGIVARLSEEKEHGLLVRAFAKVCARHPEARLLIIGDGPLLSDIRDQINGLGLEDKVVLTGMQRDIASHLALLDVFVLASSRESFPLSAREAMAASRAVIAPRIGGCPEVVDENVTGLLFESGSVDDLADKMLRLAQSEQRQAMGRAGRERSVRLFSCDAWVDGDERIYQRWAGGVIV